MTTEQNYVGGGDNAIPTPPEAQNAAQTSPSPDDRQTQQPSDWRVDFLQHVSKHNGSKEYLFAVLDLALTLSESNKTISAINELFERWVMSAPNLSEHRYAMRDIMNHVAHLSQLRSVCECFEIESDYSEYWERGGSGNE